MNMMNGYGHPGGGMPDYAMGGATPTGPMFSPGPAEDVMAKFSTLQPAEKALLIEAITPEVGSILAKILPPELGPLIERAVTATSDMVPGFRSPAAAQPMQPGPGFPEGPAAPAAPGPPRPPAPATGGLRNMRMMG